MKYLEQKRKELVGDMIFDLIGMAFGGAGIAYAINTGAPECGIFFLAAVLILLYRFWVDGKAYKNVADALNKWYQDH